MGIVDMIVIGFMSLSLAVSLSVDHIPSVSDEEISEMERSARALELYLQDQKDHDEHCPFLTWEQPALLVYKETLKSQLPDGCIK